MEALAILLILAMLAAFSFAAVTAGMTALAYLPVALWLRLRQGFGITWLLGMTALAAFLCFLGRAAGPLPVVYVLVLIGLYLLINPTDEPDDRADPYRRD